MLVRLHRRLALAEWDRGHFDIAQAHLEAGFQALAGSEPSAELAELLHVQVILLRRRGDFNGMSAAAQNLAALAQRLGSRRVLAEAYLAGGDNDLDVVAAREVAQRGLTEAELADEPLLVQRAHDILALFAYGLGEHPVARHHAMLSLALARQLGAPTLEVYPRNRLVSVDLMAGKWDEALRESAEVVATARRLGFARGIAGALGMQALVQVYRGDLDEAAASLAEAHEVFGGGAMPDRNIFNQVAIAEMMLALERGEAAGTLAAVKRLDQMLTAADVPLLAQALLAEAQVMVGEPERALTLVQDFMTHIPLDNGFAAALGSRVKGLAHQALGQPGEALACLEEAYRVFEAAAMPFDAARAHLEWATLVAATDATLVVPAVQESLAVFERLGARRYVRRARSILYKFGARPRSTPHRPRGTTSFSPRELEIVHLVADDMTNAEIAERLIISPRTVTTHLDRIYTRLGINSRTALVRYAIEAGLLPPKH